MGGSTDGSGNGREPRELLPPDRIPVLIIGAGPVGLTLGHELDHHGIDSVIVEKNATPTRHPKMDITNGRSMELYRRLGIADDLRTVAVPADHPTTSSWVTNLAGWELASRTYPAVRDTYEQIRERNDGTLPLEPAMRVSQILLEPRLRDLLEARSPQTRVHYGWMLESLDENPDGVTAYLTCRKTGNRRTVSAEYVVGCDGAGSRVRNQLGIGLEEINFLALIAKEIGIGTVVKSLARNYLTARRLPPDGRMLLVHFKTTDTAAITRLGNAWHTSSPEGWILVSQNDADTYTLHIPLPVGASVEAIDLNELVYEQLGIRFDMEILVANAWTPRLTVADSYGRGRVWLAGDAVHQVPPPGGYGMNTGVGDAVGLGWALAGQLQGWGAPGLLTAYALERRHVAIRNREAAARHATVRGAAMTTYRAAMHREGWAGERIRRDIGRKIDDLGFMENEAFGIECGYRYVDSPVICHEHSSPAPPYRTDRYTPGTWPGMRPPNVYLPDGRQLFDLLCTGFTLLRFADHPVDALVAAAAERSVPFEVVDIRDAHARELYERDLVLLRPDHHVAWRGDAPPTDPLRVIDRVRGAHNR